MELEEELIKLSVEELGYVEERDSHAPEGLPFLKHLCRVHMLDNAFTFTFFGHV